MRLIIKYLCYLSVLSVLLSCSTTRICSDYISSSKEVCHFEQDSTFILRYYNRDYTGKWRQLDNYHILLCINRPDTCIIPLNYELYGEEMAMVALNRLNIHNRCYHEYTHSKHPPYELFRLKPAYVNNPKTRKNRICYGYACHQGFWHRIYKRSLDNTTPSALIPSGLMTLTSNYEWKKENMPIINDSLYRSVPLYDPISELYVYDIVDIYPTYDNQPWQQGLMIDFNRKFTYPLTRGESFQACVIIQIVINENGELIAPRIIECENELLGKTVLQTILSCQRWTPGIIGERKVNTVLTLPIIW